MNTRKVLVCRVSNTINEADKDFMAVIKMFKDAGYEIIWENYPYTACIAKEITIEEEE